MSLVISWLAFPLLLAVLALGAGLLIERASGLRLPGPLLMPLGLAVMMLAAQAATYWGSTARAATPLVVAIALAGFAFSLGRLRAALIDPWSGLAALGVFGVFAAPVVLSGDATFAGYTVLGDTSVHFVLIDRLMSHGHDLSGLAPSSYRAALSSYFDSAYPVGAHVALGSVRPLVGQDVSAVFQPFLAFMSALTALTLYELAGSFVASRPVRALIAFVGSQPALVFAYSLQGGIKEIATVLVIALVVVTIPIALRDEGDLRRLLPLAVASAAGLAVLGFAIAPWLGPLLLACGAVLGWRRRPQWLRPTTVDAAAFMAMTVVLAFPVLLKAGDYIRTTRATLESQTEFGNLIRPLDRLQALGIWPEGDYRLPIDPNHLKWAGVLIGIGLVGALVGQLWGWRRRLWLVMLYVGVSLIGWAYVTWRGSPWADAKALMIVSAPLVVVLMLGAVALLDMRRHAEAALVAVAVTFGVMWSNALAYHEVRLAPRDRMQELREIGDRIDGRGPTLYTEFEEFAKHYLRGGDPTGWSESWQPPNVPSGRFGLPGDIDDVPPSYAGRFRTLVLRRSPSASRPPSAFRLVYRGHWYDVWQRQPQPLVLAHEAFGTDLQPGASARCRRVARLAGAARGPGARLAYVPTSRRVVVDVSKGPRPKAWTVNPSYPHTLHVLGPGRITRAFAVSSAVRYGVWLEGSFGRSTKVAIDGKPVGGVSDELNGLGQFAYLGTVTLTPGEHVLTLTRSGGDLRPGNGGDRILGPVVLSSDSVDSKPLRTAPADRSARLCGNRLDWVEAITSTSSSRP
jgi:hypothetical protein